MKNKFLEQRLAIPSYELEKKNLLLIQHLETWLKTKKFRKIFLFSSVKNEPDLQPLSLKIASQYTLALPTVHDLKTKQMEFFQIVPGEPFILNAWNIPEPDPKTHQLTTPDDDTLLCIPALYIDNQGNRIGYGQGCYDRYLARYPSGFRMGIVFVPFFGSEILTPNSWDIPVQAVCTEAGIRFTQYDR